MTQKLRLTLTLLLSFVFLTTATQADIITLKDGKILEGTIVSETDESVKIKVKLSATIMDEKTIARADIAEIKKLSEEDLAFEEIQNLIPTPPLLTSTDYSNIIRSGPERFLSTYPKSKYTTQVKDILKKLEEEKTKTSGGSIKLEGTWITAEEQRTDRVNVDSKILLYNLRRKAASGDHVGALNDFDKMEAEFVGTESLVSAIDVALASLRSYGASVNASRSDFSARMQLREKKLALLQDHVLKANQAAFAGEIAAHEARLARDQEAGIRWTAFNANSEESLRDNAALVAEQTARIQAIDRKSLATAASEIDSAKIAIKKEIVKTARKHLAAAEEVIGNKGKYIRGVIADVDKLEDTLAARRLATEDSASDVAARRIRESRTGATDGPASTVNPLQAIMAAKAAQLEKEKGKAKAKAKATATAKAKAAAAVAAAPPPPPPVPYSGGGLSFQKIIFIVAGLLIASTIGAILYQKKKG